MNNWSIAADFWHLSDYFGDIYTNFIHLRTLPVFDNRFQARYKLRILIFLQNNIILNW